MKKIKWVYKYKIKISTILIVGLFIQPFVFLQQPGIVSVSTAAAQNSMSSTFNTDSTTFSGISQWGNSQFINNPDMAKALKSCNNVVPSFQKKVITLFGRKKKIQDSTPIDTGSSGSVSLGSKKSGTTWGGCGTGVDKYSVGNSSGISELDKALYSTNELDACDTSKITPDQLKFGATDQPIKVSDLEANKKLNILLEDAKTTKEATTATKEAVEGTKVRNECMDSIAYALSRQALAGITESTVNWIETGNWDDPYYLKEPAKFFNDLKGQTLKQTLGTLFDKTVDGFATVGSQTDYPFLKSTYKGLLNKYGGKSFEEVSKSTLADVLIRVNPNKLSNNLIDNKNNSVQAFRTDFNQGGWAGWSALTQNPANNPIGFSIIASNEINKKVQEKETAIQNDLNQGSGFLSQTKCIEEVVPAIPEECIEYTDAFGKTMKKSQSSTPETFQAESEVLYGSCTKSNPAIPAHNNTRGVTAKPTDANCVQTKVVTPGSIIAERMKWSATTDIRQLELADQFNQSLGAVFTAAFNRLQTEGLEYLSKDKYGDWASQTRKQTFLERYNSQFQKVDTSVGDLNQKQLIIRREATGYSSGDFDITTDLDDQQIGCIINPGVVTTQENYIKELENTYRKPNSSGTKFIDGPLLKILPAMAELDYCIPGPTTDWESMADESFIGLYNTFIDNPIYYARKVENPDISSYYSSIGKKMQELVLTQKKTANNEKYAAATVGLVQTAIIICATTCVTGYGAIIAAAVLVAAGVTYLVSINKRKKAEKEADQWNRASEEFKTATEYAFEKEARMWSDEQITNMVNDYNLFKQETYAKFSDNNTIPVAAKARPFVNSLNSYALNSRDLVEEYKTELANAKKDLAELKIIQAEVNKIKKSATDRVRAEEKRLGLAVGALTDVPSSCKPVLKQCPAKPKINDVNVTESALPSFIDNGLFASVEQPVKNTSSSTPFPTPAVTYIKTVQDSYHPTVYYYTSANTVSVKATCPGMVMYSGSTAFPIKNTEVYGGSFIIRSDVKPGQYCDLVASGPTRGGGVETQNPPTRCTFFMDPANPAYCQEFPVKYTRGEVVPGINYFSVEPEDREVFVGDFIKFEWEVYDATKVTLTKKSDKNNILNVDSAVKLKDGTTIHNIDSINSLTGSVILVPNIEDTYVLTVTNNKKSVTREISITFKY